MNNLIEEFAIQSGAHWNHGDFNMPSSIEFQENDLEKFAKLIVQECIEQVFISIPDTMCAESGAYKKARAAAINGISEYFGV